MSVRVGRGGGEVGGKNFKSEVFFSTLQTHTQQPQWLGVGWPTLVFVFNERPNTTAYLYLTIIRFLYLKFQLYPSLYTIRVLFSNPTLSIYLYLCSYILFVPYVPTANTDLDSPFVPAADYNVCRYKLFSLLI